MFADPYDIMVPINLDIIVSKFIDSYDIMVPINLDIIVSQDLQI